MRAGGRCPRELDGGRDALACCRGGARVCVFLAGGNDGNNLIVPTSTAEYAAYAAVRSASGLAIARDSLLPVAPTSINTPFGLHRSLVELPTLWARRRLPWCATPARSSSP